MSLAPSIHLYVSSTHSSSHALLSLAAGLPCEPVGSRVSDSVLIDLQRPAGDRTGLEAEECMTSLVPNASIRTLRIADSHG